MTHENPRIAPTGERDTADLDLGITPPNNGQSDIVVELEMPHAEGHSSHTRVLPLTTAAPVVNPEATALASYNRVLAKNNLVENPLEYLYGLLILHGAFVLQYLRMGIAAKVDRIRSIKRQIIDPKAPIGQQISDLDRHIKRWKAVSEIGVQDAAQQLIEFLGTLAAFDTHLGERMDTFMRELCPQVTKKLAEIGSELRIAETQKKDFEGKSTSAGLESLRKQYAQMAQGAAGNIASLLRSQLGIIMKALAILEMNEAIARLRAQPLSGIDQARRLHEEVQTFKGDAEKFEASARRVRQLADFADTGMDDLLSAHLPEIAASARELAAAYSEHVLTLAGPLFDEDRSSMAAIESAGRAQLTIEGAERRVLETVHGAVIASAEDALRDGNVAALDTSTLRHRVHALMAPFLARHTTPDRPASVATEVSTGRIPAVATPAPAPERPDSTFYRIKQINGLGAPTARICSIITTAADLSESDICELQTSFKGNNLVLSELAKHPNATAKSLQELCKILTGQLSDTISKSEFAVLLRTCLSHKNADMSVYAFLAVPAVLNLFTTYLHDGGIAWIVSMASSEKVQKSLAFDIAKELGALMDKKHFFHFCAVYLPKVKQVDERLLTIAAEQHAATIGRVGFTQVDHQEVSLNALLSHQQITDDLARQALGMDANGIFRDERMCTYLPKAILNPAISDHFVRLVADLAHYHLTIADALRQRLKILADGNLETSGRQS